MATYNIAIYNFDPWGVFATASGGTTTYSGPATADGTAVVTDNAGGTQGLVLEDSFTESATADVTVGGSSSSGSAVFASEMWRLRDTVTNQVFEMAALRVSSGGATGYYALSEVPLVSGRSYETLIFDDVPDSSNGDPVITYSQIVCFVAGTGIATPNGPRRVEDLREGDTIITKDNGPQKVRWKSHRNVARRVLARQPRLLPIQIDAGFLGNRVPLCVSSQHGTLIEGRDDVFRTLKSAFVRAKHLAMLFPKRVRIQHQKRNVDYFHLMFEQHQVIRANGVWTESFYPGKMAFNGLSACSKKRFAHLFSDIAAFFANPVGANPYGNPARPYARARDLLLPRNVAARNQIYLPDTVFKPPRPRRPIIEICQRAEAPF